MEWFPPSCWLFPHVNSEFTGYFPYFCMPTHTKICCHRDDFTCVHATNGVGESTNLQGGRLHVWTSPLLSSSHWTWSIYLGSLLSLQIWGIFYAHRPCSIFSASNFLLWIQWIVLDQGYPSIVDHDRPLHVTVDPSGPHYFSQCEILIFNLASSHCEMNQNRRYLPFFIVTVDIRGWDHLSWFEITVIPS